jgi:hypothetical protein
LKQAEEMNEKLTPLKLIDSWMGKGVAKLRVAVVAVPILPREDLEKIIAHFLLQQYLKYINTTSCPFQLSLIVFCFLIVAQWFCNYFMCTFKCNRKHFIK